MKLHALIISVFVFTLHANAAIITSTTSGGNWSSGTTWVNGVVPSASDDIVIDGNVILISDFTLSSGRTLTINASKILTVNGRITNNGTITFQSGGDNKIIITSGSNGTNLANNGTLNCGTGTIEVNGAGANRPFSGTMTLYNVTLNNVNQMNFGGGVTINGTLKLDNGAFLGNSNQPVYGSSATLEINTSLSGWQMSNTIGLSGSYAAPNIKLSSGTVSFDYGTLITLKGTFTVMTGATFNAANACFNMVSGFTTITNNGTLNLGGITVKSGAVWNVTGNVSIATLKIESGGTVNANSYTITINNSGVNNCGGINGIMQLEAGGTFNPGTSTVVFVPAYYSNITADVSGPITFNNMVASGSSPVNIPSTSTVAVTGNVTVTTNSTISNPGNIIYDSSATVTNNGSSSGTAFPPTVETTPVSTGAKLTGTASGNYAGAAAVQSGVSVTLTGNANINSGTSKTLTVAPGAELTMGTYTVTADTVFVYGKLNISHTGGLAAAFLRSAGSPVIILGSGSTISYSSAASQTISARTDYVNLKLSGSGAKVFAAGAYSIGGDFTVEGGNVDITNTTSFTFDGTSAQSIKGLPYKNVTFTGSGNKTITDSSAVTGVITLAGAANLVSNGLITLVSDASGTASIGQITGTATITGNVNYQRYIPAGRLWRFIGWPISGNTFANSWQNDVFITGSGTGGSIGTTNSNGFDYTASSEPGLYYYNETSTAGMNARWTTVPNTSTSIDPTRGYRLFIRGNRTQGTAQISGTSYTPLPVTLKGTGTPNKGDINVSLTCSNGCTANDGWHLLSNPYPSAIDWNNSTWVAARNANIGVTVYVYNPNQNKYGAWSPTGGSVNGGTANIASGQSFYVKTNGAATLTFKEAYKVNNATVGLFGKSSGLVDNLKIQIGEPGKVYDETVVYMYDNATTGLDNNLDAVKPDVANATISTYTAANSSKLVFNAIPLLVNGDSATIFLHIPLANYTWTYNINFAGMETFGNTSTQFFLVDNFTSSTILIDPSTTSYSFTTTANNGPSYASNRFTLKIMTALGSLPVKLISFSGKKEGKTSQLKWTTASEMNSDRFEIQRSRDGINYTTIGNVKAAGYSFNVINYQFTDENPEQGINYYRLNQIDRDYTTAYSHVINLNFTQNIQSNTMTAWPIPATDVVTVELNNMEHLSADIIIRNTVGQIVYNQHIVAEETAYMHPINVEQLESGVYFIVVTPSNGAQQTIKFLKN